jgi:cellulose synthase operon protein C
MKCLPGVIRYVGLSAVILFALFLVATLVAQTTRPAENGVSILLAKARSLEARGRTDLAAENWRQVLLVNPSQSEALAGLARVAKENGNTEEEHTYLDRLRKINPKDPEIAAAENIEVITPDERKRLEEAGRLAMQHKPDEAMKIYHEILGDEPPPGKWAESFYEAEATTASGRSKAIAQLRQICARNPNNEISRLWLAVVLTYDPKARMEGFRLLESVQDPGAAEQARGPWRQALLWERENPAALASMEAYLSRYPDPQLQGYLASLRQKQEQAEEEANKGRGFHALQDNDLATAESKFQDALRRSPNDPNAVAGLGFVRLHQKRFADALALFERARALAPQKADIRDGYENAKFWLAMEQGSTARRQNNPDAGIAAYQEALAIRPMDAQAVLGIAQAEVEKKNYPAAEAKFQQVLAQSPNNPDALAGLGFISLNQGKFDQAQSFLEKAHALSPSRVDVNQGYHNAQLWGAMKKGATALDQKRGDEAVAAYRKALALNPNAKDALLGLARASESKKDYTEAIRCYTQLTAANPNDLQNWIDLIKVQLSANSAPAAMQTAERIPPATRTKLEARSDYWSEMALAYYGVKQGSAGEKALQKSLETADAGDRSDALNVRLQIAGMLMESGQILRAIDIYKQATQAQPNNSAGWQGLVGAYVRMRDYPHAKVALRSMPQSSYDMAGKNPDFLDLVATIYSAQGQCGEAEDLLNRSIALDKAADRQPAESTRLQLSNIWMREHNYERAAEAYRQITLKDQDSQEAWRGYVAALHALANDQAAVSETQRIPAAVFTTLEKDPRFLMLLASAQSATGQTEPMIRSLEQASSIYQNAGEPTPIDLDLQLAWAMVDSGQHDSELQLLLNRTRNRSDLGAGQRRAIDEIWADWSIRRANQAVRSRKPGEAVAILTAAASDLPGDRRIPAALASLYTRQRDWNKALAVYESWKMAGADAADYRTAAGAALSAHKNLLADHFMREGLLLFPNDVELLHMTARQAVVNGNYKEAERYLKLALAASRQPQTNPQQSTWATEQDAFEDKSKSSLKSGPTALSALSSTPTTQPIAMPACEGTSGSAASDLSIRPISRTSTYPDPHGADIEEIHNIQDEIDVVQDRNTPFVAATNLLAGRAGDPGFDRLIVEDGAMSSFYTATNAVRFGVEGRGVYLFSGSPNGSSGYRFGSLAEGATFNEQSALGYAGDLQLSTNTFGFMFGVTPRGFPVENFIGGLRFRPLNGPVTFTAARDSVKDSLLSYAGVRDPASGVVYGGVVSSGGTVQLRWDPSPTQNSHIGAYVSGGGAFLQGKNVPDNWQVTGMAGLYGRVVKGLTLGVHVSGMHYDRNLQYFSLGQGGYFSPQAYGLASIPISYFARHQRFEYRLRMSGGVQYISEDASPFYPTSAGAALPNQGLYASSTHTGPNYDVDFRFGYRVSPHVYFEAFASANNARNYTYQAAGFSLRFLIRRLPTDTDLHPKSVPDWQGNPPFGVE